MYLIKIDYKLNAKFYQDYYSNSTKHRIFIRFHTKFGRLLFEMKTIIL